MPSNDMTKSDASRIQSTQDKNGGDMSSNGFASRAQAAGDKNNNSSAQGQSYGGRNASGGKGGNSGGGNASGGKGGNSGGKGQSK